MSRQKFIESHGATCDNWRWSWSFVNHKNRFVIFGAWDVHAKENRNLILSPEWQFKDNGKKNVAYQQSRKHIKLIEEKGYRLKTFPMQFSGEDQDEKGFGPSKLGGFDPILTERQLSKDGEDWYANDCVMPKTFLPEEILGNETFTEGLKTTITVNAYERSGEAREKCLQYHGYQCSICTFDFEKVYGDIGANYIHVHHIVPISEVQREYKVNPVEDLIPVCPNCHAMIHRTRPAQTVEQLKKQFRNDS